MKKYLIICLLAVAFAGCKKEESLNEYLIEVVTDDVDAEFTLGFIDRPSVSVKKPYPKYQFRYSGEKASSKIWIEDQSRGLNPGKNMTIYNYKNGTLMLTKTFKCEETTKRCPYYITENIGF